jgi:uncharacterized spore protein YtfJ
LRVLDQVKEIVDGTTVFDKPLEKNGITVIPASRLTAGGGGGEQGGESSPAGGGAGVQATPAGALVIKGDAVTWVPAVDLNRIVMISQLLVLVGILSWRSVAAARARRRF